MKSNYCFLVEAPTNKIIQLKDKSGNLLYPNIAGVTEAEIPDFLKTKLSDLQTAVGSSTLLYEVIEHQ